MGRDLRTSTLTGLAALMIAALAAVCFAPSAGAYVYWVNTNSVGRANLDGSGVDQNFIPAANGFQCGIAVDSAHLYFVDGPSSIARANLDGSGLNPSFITGGSTVCGVAVDGSHIFWANQGSNTIGRANLDGSGIIQNLVTGATGACGPAVGAGHLYWGDYGALSGVNAGNGTTVGRADLDASGNVSNVKQNFITGAKGPCFVAVDGANVYWENTAGGGGTGIGRASLDLSSVDQSAYTVPPGPCGLAVDGSHVYWGHLGGGSGTTIGRATLDNNLLEPNFITGAAQPCGVAVDSLAPSPPAPSNNFSFGKLKLNPKNGTATLIVDVPGPGTLAVGGKQVKAQRAAGESSGLRARVVHAAGPVKLVIGAKGKALKKLRRTGKVKVMATIAFTPTGGSANIRTKKLKLVRHRR